MLLGGATRIPSPYGSGFPATRYDGQRPPRKKEQHMARHKSSRQAVTAGDEAASAPRIIGGDLRGRRLEFVPHGRTRPMKDRVRESLFDLLGTGVRGALALDLFAGTGRSASRR